jgi:hypothetical protein
MKKYFGFIITITITAVLAVSPAFAQDPSFYVKKDTWPETMLASREELIKAEETPGGVERFPNFGTTDFTISAWIRTTEPVAPILSKNVALGMWTPQGKTFFLRDGKPSFAFGNLGVAAADIVVNDGQWHHVVVAGRDPLDFYVDGTYAKTAGIPRARDIPPDAAEHNLSVGWCSWNYPAENKGFEGNMDELRVYNRRLSADEVKALNADPKVAQSGLTGWWPFDNGAVDVSGNFNDGKLTNVVPSDGKFGPGMYFNSQSGVELPYAPGGNSRAKIAEFVARDFTTEDAVQEIAWETQDHIWNADWKLGDFSDLAARYAKACVDLVGYPGKAAALLDGANTAAGLAKVRGIYLLSQRNQKRLLRMQDKSRLMVAELDYLQELHSADDELWNTYKAAVKEFSRECAPVLAGILAGDEDAMNKLAAIEEKQAAVHGNLPHRLPAGPAGKRHFGALYTTLKYTLEWDKPWRISDHADVIVRFADGDHRFVFWRGANYIPNWVTPNGIWYNNQFTETWVPGIAGSFEPMSDKQCRYSHVRVIESNDARVVIHWRYALNDVDYNIAWPDERSGWGDWVDEYYVIYPDAVSVRHLTCHSSHWGDNAPRHTDDAGHEYQEGILVYNTGSLPEESVELDAVHVANMKAETAKWSWENHGHPTTPTPEGTNIAWMNVKSDIKPFVVSPEGCGIAPYEGSQGGSHFRWRDHWPTEMGPAPGRDASGKKAAHGSFFHLTKIPVYKKGQDWISKVILHGLTPGGAGSVVPLARSWLYAPELKLSGSGFTSAGYDPTQRAYVLTCKNKAGKIEFELQAGKESPVVNPAFVVKGWGEDGASLTLNGKKVEQGRDFRVGHRHKLDTSDLIVWIRIESSKAIYVTLTPANS